MSAGTAKVLAVACLIAGVIGGILISGNRTETVYRNVPGPVRIEKVPGPVVTKTATLPQECFEAMAAAGSLVTTAGAVNSASSQALDYLTAVRTVAVTKDTNKANLLENEIRRYHAKQIGNSYTLSTEIATFNDLAATCQEKYDNE